MNDRITPKERNLLKGAMRRVFSRSDLRRLVLNKVDIIYQDPNRPRVKKWSQCPICNKPTPKYLMQVDHTDPVIPTDRTLETMTWDEVIDRLWCHSENLTPMCEACHSEKTKLEREERKLKKKGTIRAQSKRAKKTVKKCSKRAITRSSKSRTIRNIKKTRRYKNF